MPGRTVQPYGTWISSITGSAIASESIHLDEVKICSSGIYWIERRPSEQGRCVIVCNHRGITKDYLPPPYSARSRVNEYGGGAYCPTETGVFFVNDSDQNIYFISNDHEIVQITDDQHIRYADLVFDSVHHRIICVQETHSSDTREPVNSIVTINQYTGSLSRLCSGSDFYSSLRLSPDGKQLAWLCWNHPNMPWDGSQLWIADISGATTISNSRLVAGSDSISIFQPEWSADNMLHFVSDESGWWNLYAHQNTSTALTHEKMELGLPQWVHGQTTYAFLGGANILCSFIHEAQSRLALLNRFTGKLEYLSSQWSSISYVCAYKNTCAFIAASRTTFPEVISANVDDLNYNLLSITPLKNSMQCTSHESFSVAKSISFKTRHDQTSHALYYPPLNSRFTSSVSEKPPLIVLTHGGPTAMSTDALDIRKQFWTSRGFALLDVNYSGSTGYGRKYRERLNYNWGIRDVEDCCDAALYIVKQGLADPDRLIIKGSSAGGYTVLCALAFHNVFSAGASYYGIGDLKSLLSDTHKFESHYLDTLIGPYQSNIETYHARSPLYHLEGLNCPVIFLQGKDDKVVPKEQTYSMYTALRNKGIPVACMLFEGEQHGFRKSKTIELALESELAFYSKIFKLDRNDTVSIDIENLGDSLR